MVANTTKTLFERANELKADKGRNNAKAMDGLRAEMIAEAERIQAELDAPDCDLTAEQRNAREGRVDNLIGEAQTLKQLAGLRRGGGGKAIDGGDPGTVEMAERVRACEPLPKYSAADIEDLDSGGFGGMGDFLQAVTKAKTGQGFDSRLQYLSTDMGKYSGPDGGFLVPERLQAEVVMSATESAAWLRSRREFVMRQGQGGNATWPILADRDQSDGKLGNFQLLRANETATLAESSARLESSKLELNKAGGLVPVSNELLYDGIGVDQLLVTLFGEAVSQLQARDFVDGLGVGEPTGVLQSAALYTVAKESGQAADTIVYDNVTKMRARCRNFENAIWLAHPSTLPQLMSLVLPIGTGGVAMWQPSAREGDPDMLLGRPLYLTSACKTLGDKGDLILCHPRSYYYIQSPMIVDTSRHVAFKEDQTYFKVVLRDDGKPIFGSTFTDYRSYEQSEFVTLDERA